MPLLDNPASSILAGRKVVAAAGTAEALSTSNERIISVVIQAETDNGDKIAVGDADVVEADATRTGIALSAGDSITLNVAQLSSVYIDAAVNGEGVTFLALKP